MKRSFAALAVLGVGYAVFVLINKETPEVSPRIAERGSVFESAAKPKTKQDSVSGIARVPASQTDEAPITELARLNECYKGGCDFPNTYPREYEFAVGRDLKKALLRYSSKVENEKLVSDEVSKMGREFLSNDDGHVKEGSLHLLATQPPSTENLRAILESVVAETDSLLIEHAMLELQRYKTAENLKVIHSALGEAILTGSPFVSTAISQNLGSFIDSYSYSYYSQLVTRTSPGSVVHSNLRALLDDYRKRSTGA